MIRDAAGKVLSAVFPLLESATIHTRDDVGPLAAVVLGLAFALLAGLAAWWMPSRSRRRLLLLLSTSASCAAAYVLATGIPTAQAFVVWEYAVPRHDLAIFGSRGPAAYAGDVLVIALKLATLAAVTTAGGQMLIASRGTLTGDAHGGRSRGTVFPTFLTADHVSAWFAFRDPDLARVRAAEHF